jgi:acyl carrier protein
MDPRRQIEMELRRIIADVAPAGGATIAADEDLVEVLGVDSLQGLQILAEVERRFDIRLRDEELIQMRSVARIVTAIEQARAEAPAPAAAGGRR